MTFKVVNKYLQDNNRTFVAIRQEAPYTAFDRVLIGNHMNESDEDLIKAVIAQVTTEFNPAEGVKKLQEDLQIQAQEGKRVMVQVNEPFTYQGETLEQLATLEQNGKLGIWKWTEPKAEANATTATPTPAN